MLAMGNIHVDIKAPNFQNPANPQRILTPSFKWLICQLISLLINPLCMIHCLSVFDYFVIPNDVYMYNDDDEDYDARSWWLTISGEKSRCFSWMDDKFTLQFLVYLEGNVLVVCASDLQLCYMTSYLQ